MSDKVNQVTGMLEISRQIKAERPGTNDTAMGVLYLVFLPSSLWHLCENYSPCPTYSCQHFPGDPSAT